MAVSLDFDGLCEEALRRSGAPGFETLDFAVGLRTLLRSAETDAALTREGRRLLQAEILRVLIQRLSCGTTLQPNPALDARQVLVITGLPRTGSTLLHHALASDPNTAAIPLWQALRPFPPADLPSTTAIGEADLQLRLMDRLSPALRQIHPMEARWPEECISLLQLTGASEKYTFSLYVPDYADWLYDRPMVDEYRVLRGIIDAILPANSRVVLKAPSHLPFIRNLATVWPDAKFVVLHRDATDAVASFCSLVRAARLVFSDADRSRALGQEWESRWRERLADAREDAPDSSMVAWLSFDEVRVDPARAISHIGDQLDWRARTTAEDLPEAHRHRYSPTEFGITTGRKE